jgi:FkbM family methyltransferase
MPLNNFSYYLQHGLFEAPLIEWSKQFCRPDSLFLDIGAHTGSYAITMAPLCKKVVAFEPQRMTYYALCGGVALSGATNVECCPFGLGSEEQIGTNSLYIVSVDGGGSTVHAPPPSNVFQTESIEIRTLDSMTFSDPISFIKIDVEQNELNVVRGGERTIRLHTPTLLFEQNDPAHTIHEMTSFFQQMEYEVLPVNRSHNMFLAVPVRPKK